MDLQLVRDRLYQKYIAPTKRERDSFIGMEVEMPIVNLKNEPVDFDLVHRITKEFMDEFDFVVDGVDDDGFINACSSKETGDILSYDCSYNNLELSMGREKEMNALNERFRNYVTWLVAAFEKKQHTLTGMGVNPHRTINNNVPIPNERYRMLFHHLGTYRDYFNYPMYFHRHRAFGTFSSASQVQLDVNYDKLIPTIRAFSKVEPIKALLFSNSILLGENEDLVCCRDMLWENSTHGINPHNIGMYDTLPETVEELEDYIASTSMYCVMRDGVYINFRPIPVMEYFSSDKVEGEYYKGGSYHKIDVVPELDDLAYLRTFKFEDLTFRGTIEYRSVCCQPLDDVMTVSAFHVGLVEKVDELDKLLEEDHVLYHHSYTASELRKMFNMRELPGFVSEDDVYALAKTVIDLAAEGLKERGYGEEVFLEPLYDRIEKRENPATHLLKEKENGVPLADIIKEYGIH